MTLFDSIKSLSLYIIHHWEIFLLLSNIPLLVSGIIYWISNGDARPKKKIDFKLLAIGISSLLPGFLFGLVFIYLIDLDSIFHQLQIIGTSILLMFFISMFLYYLGRRNYAQYMQTGNKN